MLLHSPESGSILSLLGEVVVPIDDADDGFGGGTVKLESFLMYGQLLPWDSFVQLQGGVRQRGQIGADPPGPRDRQGLPLGDGGQGRDVGGHLRQLGIAVARRPRK